MLLTWWWHDEKTAPRHLKCKSSSRHSLVRTLPTSSSESARHFIGGFISEYNDLTSGCHRNGASDWGNYTASPHVRTFHGWWIIDQLGSFVRKLLRCGRMTRGSLVIMLSSCLVIMSAIFSWAKSAIAWCWVTICVSIHKNIPSASPYLLVKSYHGWPIAAWQQPHQTNAMNPPLTATWCYTGLSKKVDSKLGDLVKSLV